MTFEAREESRYLGEPIALYRFTIGNQVIGYTDADEVKTFEGNDYDPIPIDRGAYNSSGTLDKANLEIRLPHDTAIAEMFRVFPPSQVVWLTIFGAHGDDGDFVAGWSGRVLSAKREDSEAVLTCESIITSLRRPGLRVRDQYQCVHALYGPSCGVSREDFTVASEIVTVSGAFITLPIGWNGAFEKSKFTNGILQWTQGGRTEQRHILRVNGTLNQLQIGGQTDGLAPGTIIELSLGCSHNMGDCRDLFANIQSFGGCPWIPKKNPIGMTNVFY